MIWDHEGNASNILFSAKTMRLACIDQPFMAIIDPNQKKQYLEKVEKFAKCIQETSNVNENPYIAQLCSYMRDVTGINLDEIPNCKVNIHSLRQLTSLRKYPENNSKSSKLKLKI